MIYINLVILTFLFYLNYDERTKDFNNNWNL